jgi:hypothetical protein
MNDIIISLTDQYALPKMIIEDEATLGFDQAITRNLAHQYFCIASRIK